MSALYLYCFARPLPGPDAPAFDPGQQFEGVAIIGHEGIFAVYTEADAAEFSERNLQSMEWVAPRALKHAHTVQQLLEQASVLPVKFGTLIPTPELLHSLLVRNHAVMQSHFSQLEDKTEWSLKGFLDLKKAVAHIKANDPEVRARMAELPESPGARFLLMRKLDKSVESLARSQAEEQASAIVRALMPLAVEASNLRLHGTETSGRKEAMIVNKSFLIADEHSDAFIDKVDILTEQALEAGLVLTLQGPWPPYNHCPALTL